MTMEAKVNLNLQFPNHSSTKSSEKSSTKSSNKSSNNSNNNPNNFLFKTPNNSNPDFFNSNYQTPINQLSSNNYSYNKLSNNLNLNLNNSNNNSRLNSLSSSITSISSSIDSSSECLIDYNINFNPLFDKLILSTYSNYLSNPQIAPFNQKYPPSGIVSKVSKEVLKSSIKNKIPIDLNKINNNNNNSNFHSLKSPETLSIIRQRLLFLCNLNYDNYSRNNSLSSAISFNSNISDVDNDSTFILNQNSLQNSLNNSINSININNQINNNASPNLIDFDFYNNQNLNQLQFQNNLPLNTNFELKNFQIQNLNPPPQLNLNGYSRSSSLSSRCSSLSSYTNNNNNINNLYNFQLNNMNQNILPTNTDPSYSNSLSLQPALKSIPASNTSSSSHSSKSSRYSSLSKSSSSSHSSSKKSLYSNPNDLILISTSNLDNQPQSQSQPLTLDHQFTSQNAAAALASLNQPFSLQSPISEEFPYNNTTRNPQTGSPGKPIDDTLYTSKSSRRKRDSLKMKRFGH
ncbi:uncharacterized protein ASCRUDRAFT_75719 [Ascoidea rubescens DSM 1968]|uniref:Uncharacterized protein n=1 Tax=Ascoidea rubescens DSM 1968 TaxID=1344418 RepID=A0A1D2VH34_9ASCO|nr:hypothetical protein ASCRUDRAFT_75719 [Ascoidea rubescens DSM 1968]ODV60964.1 hypothetical protein ASCRUDRAFT_75719 [Ascoidea rubescens DSM 1968]